MSFKFNLKQISGGLRFGFGWRKIFCQFRSKHTMLVYLGRKAGYCQRELRKIDAGVPVSAAPLLAPGYRGRERERGGEGR